MFRKSRKKIVAAIMLILLALFLGTFAIIYVAGYTDITAKNRQMLELYSERYQLQLSSETFPPDFNAGTPYPDNGFPPSFDFPIINNPQDPSFRNPMSFQLSTFCSVAMTDDGTILKVISGNESVYSENELIDYASHILDGRRTEGKINNLLYLVSDKGEYKLVAFIDNTFMFESISSLMRYTLIFGGLAILALLAVSVFLAKKIVDPLEESYTKQKQFISDAGHELKTPVSVVSANAEMLEREIGENQWLSNIQYENERMGKLISELLELSRTENATMVMEYLDFSRLVSREALSFESVAFEKGFTLNCNIEDRIHLSGNEGKLTQLVSILIDNAIRHSSGGNDIALSLKRNHGHAYLSVSNPGEPIPDSEREQLFDRFYRVDQARNSDSGHYGLGLAIAKAVVTAHNGKIDVICENGYVTFKASFPLR